jgi:O-antigen/teichoic acid export membrane protein
VFWSNLIATAIVTVAMTVWVMGRVGAGIDRQALGSLTRYGLPLVATNVATFFVAFGDRYFIEATHGTAEVGRYSLAYQFGFLLASIGYAPFTAVWDSRRFAIALDPDRDALYSRAFLGMNLWLIPMAVGMGLFAPEVLRVMTTPDYFMPPAVIVFILVSYILQGWTHIHEIGILLAEKTRYVAVANWIAAGVAAIAYALLIPPLGGLGAAVATIIAMSARFTAVYVYSQRLTPISWRWGPSLRLAGIAAAAMAVGAVLPMMNIGPSFALRGTTFVAFAVAVWLAPDVLGERERAIVRLAFRSPQQALAALRG